MSILRCYYQKYGNCVIDESGLLRRFNGDDKWEKQLAVDRIIGKYSKMLIASSNAAFRQCLPGSVEKDDLEIVAISAVLEGLPKYDIQKGKFSSFVYSTVNFGLKDALRSMNYGSLCKIAHHSNISYTPYWSSSLNDVDVSYDDNDQIIDGLVIEQALGSLDSFGQQHIRAVFFDDMSLSDLAKQHGCGKTTMHKRIHGFLDHMCQNAV